MINKRLLFFIFSHFALRVGLAQSNVAVPVNGTFEDIPVIELIQIFEKDYDTKIYYEPKRIPYFKVTYTFANTPLYQALRKVVAGTVLSVQYYEDKIVLLPKQGASKEKVVAIIDKWESGEYQKPIESGPERVVYNFGDSLSFEQDSSYRLSGTIRDRYSKTPVIGVTIINLASGSGATTDVTGYFEYRSNGGKVNLLLSYLGYRSIDLEIGLYEDAELNIELSVGSIDLNEVIIEGRSSQNKIEEAEAGLEFISATKFKEIPSFLGEPDVIRSLERLPGISTVSEVSSGFNVRGGDIDQNLILLDEAIIFNPSHALGFFSILHPDAVSGVSLYKGHIPAKYGGRLSSVLAVETKDPHTSKWHGSGGLGIASARLKIEGPLIEHKTGFLLGMRSTYSDWILKQADNEDVSASQMYFGDGLVKLSHELGTKNQLSLTAYFSHDYFRFSDEFGFSWRSGFVNLKWFHLVKNKIALSTHLIKGFHRSTQFEPTGIASFNLNNGIDYVKLKSLLSLDLSNHFVVAGIELIRTDMQSQSLTPYDTDSGIRPESVLGSRGYEMSLYAENRWAITPNLSFLIGLRSALFIRTGPDMVFQYVSDLPKSKLTVIDTIHYRSGEIVKTFNSLEPRFSLHLVLNPSLALKASYNTQRQYSHLISNTAVTTPIDLWVISDPHIKPTIAHNISIGGYKDINSNWSVSLETFYKISDNIIQYKDFAELVLNEALETDLVQGLGRAYGIELLFKKHTGRISGQVAYTFSHSEVRTNGIFEEEQVNFGTWYPTNFDQPHQLNFEIKYKFNAITSCQISFTYKSGRPITPPVAGYQIGGVLVTDYSGRNAYSIPDYHRLDFAFNIDSSKSGVSSFRNSFSLSFYNIYARQNALTLFFRRDSKNIPRAYQLAILGKMFPSLTWNVNF